MNKTDANNIKAAQHSVQLSNNDIYDVVFRGAERQRKVFKKRGAAHTSYTVKEMTNKNLNVIAWS